MTESRHPADLLSFAKLIHGADERVPVQASEFGTEAIIRLLSRLLVI